ncbi:hypothetical protein ACWCOT_23020 [Nonomuraea bangladeshensis]
MASDEITQSPLPYAPRLQELTYPPIAPSADDFAAHGEEIHEVLSIYGNVVYCLQRFEMFMLMNAVQAVHGRAISRASDEDFASLQKKTMGQLRRTLLERRADLDDLEADLKRVLDLRNFLIHEYFRDRSQAMSLSDGRRLMIEELIQATDFLEEVFARYTSMIYAANSGITIFLNVRRLDERRSPRWIGEGDDVAIFGQPLPGLHA